MSHREDRAGLLSVVFIILRLTSFLCYDVMTYDYSGSFRDHMTYDYSGSFRDHIVGGADNLL